MSKKHKQVSRHEPNSAPAQSGEAASVVPAGTPVAPSAPEVPAADQQPKQPATGESLPDVVSAVQPEPKPVEPPRRGGASFFIPPQKPSGFGVK